MPDIRAFLWLHALLQMAEQYIASLMNIQVDQSPLNTCILSNFAWYIGVCWFFSKSTFSKNSFKSTVTLSNRQFGSRSGPTLCRAWSGSKLFANVISRRHEKVKSFTLMDRLGQILGILILQRQMTYAIAACKYLFTMYRKSTKSSTKYWMGAQWLSGRMLDSRPKGSGFEPHRRHCVVVLEQDTFILA